MAIVLLGLHREKISMSFQVGDRVRIVRNDRWGGLRGTVLDRESVATYIVRLDNLPEDENNSNLVRRFQGGDLGSHHTCDCYPSRSWAPKCMKCIDRRYP
jgi:hypothetical protein